MAQDLLCLSKELSSVSLTKTDYQSILADMAAGKAQLVDIREQNEWDYGLD